METFLALRALLKNSMSMSFTDRLTWICSFAIHDMPSHIQH